MKHCRPFWQSIFFLSFIIRTEIRTAIGHRFCGRTSSLTAELTPGVVPDAPARSPLCVRTIAVNAVARGICFKSRDYRGRPDSRVSFLHGKGSSGRSLSRVRTIRSGSGQFDTAVRTIRIAKGHVRTPVRDRLKSKPCQRLTPFVGPDSICKSCLIQ